MLRSVQARCCSHQPPKKCVVAQRIFTLIHMRHDNVLRPDTIRHCFCAATTTTIRQNRTRLGSSNLRTQASSQASDSTALDLRPRSTHPYRSLRSTVVKSSLANTLTHQHHSIIRCSRLPGGPVEKLPRTRVFRSLHRHRC